MDKAIPLPGYEDSYLISAEGRVWSLRKTPPVEIGKGNGVDYRHVCLQKEGKKRSITVHRLVAEVFIGPANGRNVNHKNGNRSDNRVDNLEYCTPREDAIHRWASRRVKLSQPGRECPQIFTDSEEIKNIVPYIVRAVDCCIDSGTISKIFGVSPYEIAKCIRSIDDWLISKREERE